MLAGVGFHLASQVFIKQHPCPGLLPLAMARRNLVHLLAATNYYYNNYKYKYW